MELNIEEIYDDTNNDDVASIDTINNIDNINKEVLANLNNIVNNNSVNHVEDEKVSQLLNYRLNYTVKELTKICEYYKTYKQLKINKYSKETMIHEIVAFENDLSNKDLVERRQLLWFCINELKNDKHMKKYVIWG